MSTFTIVLGDFDDYGRDAIVEDQKAALIQVFDQHIPQSVNVGGCCDEHILQRLCRRLRSYPAMC